MTAPILVTGGTGTLGRLVVARLLDRGRPVRVLTRHPREPRDGLEYVTGDLLQGVRFFGGGARTHSLVMAYQTKQVRFVDTVHMFDRESPPRVRL